LLFSFFFLPLLCLCHILSFKVFRSHLVQSHTFKEPAPTFENKQPAKDLIVRYRGE